MLKNTEAVVNAVRYAVRTQGTWKSFVEENGITRDQIAETAKALAALAYPSDEPVQKVNGTRTRFGNAVQAAGNGMRSVLDKDEANATPVTLRVSLSGEGGGSTVVPSDHPLYLALCELATGNPAMQVVA